MGGCAIAARCAAHHKQAVKEALVRFLEGLAN